jgi:hypothetical protein
MARIIKNINPVDLKPSTGVGLSLPFDGPIGFNLNYTTKDQLRNNIKNFLNTAQRERPFQPNFGANLRQFLFEANDDMTLGEIKSSIQDSLHMYFPNINVDSIELLQSVDAYLINVVIKYSIPNLNLTDILTLQFNNGNSQ